MPTDFDDAVSGLIAAFAAVWSATPVAYQNTPFEPTTGTAYVAFGVQEIPSFQVSTGAPGANRVRRPLLVTVDIRTPVDDGPISGRLLAKQVAAIFDLKTVAGISFRTSSLTPVGPDGAWYRWRVTVEGYYDVLR